MFGRKKVSLPLSAVEKAFMELVEKYTSICMTAKGPAKDAKRKPRGTFATGVTCSLYLVSKNGFAIRFEDNMKEKEFHEVFHLLVKDFGEPNLMAEFRGYVWKKDGYVITFGHIPLNYDYEVPMICVERTLGLFTNSTPYQTYHEIANAILTPLESWGIILDEEQCFPISYLGKEGYIALSRINNHLVVLITYKKGTLHVTMTPVTRLEYGVAIEHTAKRYQKTVEGVGVAEIAAHLESILEESKEFHGLTRATQ